jgi:hypothetical protein
VDGLTRSSRYRPVAAIVDPATGTQIQDYMNNTPYGGDFIVKGTVVDPSGASALVVALDSNASLLAMAPDRTQTGLDPESGTTLQNIPQSAYHVDQFQAADSLDVLGPVDVIEPSHIVDVFQPKQGAFRIVATGLSAGPYRLSVRSWTQDGTARPPIVLTGTAEPGSSDTYEVQFNASTAGTTTATYLPGDRNGDGVVNCADLEIIKAAFGQETRAARFRWPCRPEPRRSREHSGSCRRGSLDACGHRLQVAPMTPKPN